MEPIRAAVVGAGFVGAAHLEALGRLPGVEVAGLADWERPEEKAEALGVPQGFTDYREMIETLRPQVVHICTPNHLHRDAALYALERGAHVVCEKLLCRTMEEAEELVEAGRKSGLVCAVNYHNRFYPMAFELRRRVQKGELGRIFSVHGSYLQDWLLYDTDYSWRLLSGQGGSTRAYGDIGSHWVDLSEFVLGRRVTAVQAQFSTVHPVRRAPAGPVHTFGAGDRAAERRSFPVDTEDVCMALLRYEGGVIGSLVVSQVFAGAKNALSLQVAGERESASWELERCNELGLGRRDGPNAVLTKSPDLLDPGAAALSSYPGGHGEGFADAFKQHFRQIYRRIRQPDAPRDFATFEDGRRLLSMGEKLLESARTGGWVSV